MLVFIGSFLKLYSNFFLPYCVKISICFTRSTSNVTPIQLVQPYFDVRQYSTSASILTSTLFLALCVVVLILSMVFHYECSRISTSVSKSYILTHDIEA